MFITHRWQQLFRFFRQNYLSFVISTHFIFFKVGKDLCLYKYYLDTLRLQEVNTDVLYSALKQDTKPDGRLCQREGVAGFGTFLHIKLLVECQFDPTHVYPAATSLFQSRLVR